MSTETADRRRMSQKQSDALAFLHAGPQRGTRLHAHGFSRPTLESLVSRGLVVANAASEWDRGSYRRTEYALTAAGLTRVLRQAAKEWRYTPGGAP